MIKTIELKIKKPWYMSLNKFHIKFRRENPMLLNEYDSKVSIRYDVDCKYLIITIFVFDDKCDVCPYLRGNKRNAKNER